MGWIQKCCETYDNNLHMVGKHLEGQKTSLAPLFSTNATARIEITLSERGEFVSASAINKNDCNTLIPITEDSASRTSTAVFPHPLCDQLGYVALGHSSYPDHAAYESKYRAYMAQLQRWVDSDYVHFIVAAVFDYCQRGGIVEDLVKAGVVAVDKNGILEKGKINNEIYEKCLVRWRVQKLGSIGECWLNNDLFTCYTGFCIEENHGLDDALCYITGERTTAAKKCPAGVLRIASKAKIISANDDKGFTYRGRFTEPSEAFAVGAVSSQKAHSALAWLSANQGISYGPRTFICWNPKGKQVVPFDADLAFIEDDNTEVDYALTMPEYTQRLRKAIAGERQALGDNADIVIIAMEAATTGRLSITYYSELASSDYLRRLEDWQLSCCWYRAYTDKTGTFRTVVSSPSIKDIIRFSYGTQQGDFVSADDNLMKEHAQRILHCIIDGAPLQYDIVHSIAMKASQRSAYSADNYDRLLSIACALIRKCRNDLLKINNSKGEEWTMELDVTRTDRSYLFGRLLAVAEKVERSTYERDEKREPAALRLQAAFAAHPMRTWAILESSLVPYFAKLKPGSRRYYRDLIGEIVAGLETLSDVQLNRPLEDSYLLGYYLQRRDLNTRRSDNTKIEESPLLESEE